MEEDKRPTNIPIQNIEEMLENEEEDLIGRREPRLTNEMLARVAAPLTHDDIKEDVSGGEENVDWHSVVPKVGISKYIP